MLQVTDRALNKLTELRANEHPESGQGIALIPAEGVLNLAMARPTAQDQVIEQNGEPVVIVPGPVAEQLDGWVLDYQGLPGSEEFTIGPAGPSLDGLAPV